MELLSQFIALSPNALIQALILAFIATGIMIPFRILDFPDLTSEGAFPLGGALCATLIGLFDPISALLVGAIGGGMLGVASALLHHRFKVHSLLAGIILTTMIYSVNLRLMGRPNIPLFGETTLFLLLGESFLSKILFLGVLNLVTLGFIYFFLCTETGLRFRALGYNPSFVQKLGISLPLYLSAGLFLSNFLNGLGGGLMVQLQNYADIGMGLGIVIHGLAALMIGEMLLNTKEDNPRFLHKQLLAPLIGALAYEQIRAFVIAFGLPPSDHKFVTGVIVIVAIGVLKNKKLNYA